MFLQILPVSIKSLAGSVATLANWLGAWAVTMTASLMLSWSNGGTLLSLLLKSISFPLQHQIWPFLVLIRNFCYLCCRVYHGSHFCVLVGAGDQRKNARGNCIFIPLKQSNVLRPSIIMRVWDPPMCYQDVPFGTLNPWSPQQSCSHVLFGCTILCLYIVQYDSLAGGSCVYMCKI